MDDFDSFQRALIDTVGLRPGGEIVEEIVRYDGDGAVFDGVLVRDASLPMPLPTVVVVHDWFGVGSNTRMRLHMFARLGYAAFAVDLFGAALRPTSGQDAQALARRFYAGELSFARRMSLGYEAARSHDAVDLEHSVVLGYCFGGAATLEFARTGVPARGFVAVHGGLPTHGGEGIDRIAGSLLILTGASDPVVPDSALLAFEDEMRTRPDLDWMVVSYSGAPHAFTVPGDSYREKADRRSWREIEGFLAELIA